MLFFKGEMLVLVFRNLLFYTSSSFNDVKIKMFFFCIVGFTLILYMTNVIKILKITYVK